MVKVWQCVSLLVVLWIGVAIGEGCLHQDQSWGDVNNPYIFYLCDVSSNTSVQSDCPPNSGFVNNGTELGCVSWDQWNSACVSQIPPTPETCGADSYRQPHGYGDPSFYYLCLEKDAQPVKIPCANGRGFYSNNGYLGCFPWPMWRNLTGCLK